ncbi:Fc.00g104140.m01.CDS01 [Cosmosporella sp. VM-42]
MAAKDSESRHVELSHDNVNVEGAGDFIEDTSPGLFLALCIVAKAIDGRYGPSLLVLRLTSTAMRVGHVLVGLEIGSASMIISLYIAEISPARYRGRMISIDMVFSVTGSLLAYAFDAAFHKVDHGWRYIVGLGGISSILLGVLLFWYLESPRQLLLHSRKAEFISVYATLQAKALTEEVPIRKATKGLLTVPANRRAAIVACGLMATQQLCGFNTLMYYSSTFFQNVGFNDPIAVGTVIAGTNWICTVLSIFLIDHVGRRRLLL